MSKLRNLLKNEHVRSVIFLAIILGGVIAFWFGLRTYLRTDYPLLAVASGSMVPTLKVGDLIVVQGGIDGDDIVAEYGSGDIVVFYSPRNPSELIVHRAVSKSLNGEVWYFRTKGDHNPDPDSWNVPETRIVGKVVWIIPYLGHVSLFVHTTIGMVLIIGLIVVLVLVEFLFPSTREKEETDQPEAESDVFDSTRETNE
ncbi:MAG: signal peptidase I [Candidatus Bathyarchaeota archaeon]|nr:MAG: signal peptidase I [Candidatus Bathyarchaeota archaeon]